MMNFSKKSVRDKDVAGKTALVRCDFNVPLSESGEITDNGRIVSSLPTIRYLLEHGASVVLCSHLGRPKGEVNPKYSLAPVAKELSRLLGMPVPLARDTVGEDAQRLRRALLPGGVMLLENLRFQKEEEKNDPDFAKKLASFGDLFVNDAFGTAHRAHASTAGVADYLPAVCGLLIEKELRVMGAALENPARPFVAVLGGAKVSDKIGVIRNLLSKCDKVLVGGAMAYTFYLAEGRTVGTSRCEPDKVELAAELIRQGGEKLVLPSDGLCAAEFSESAAPVRTGRDIPDGLMGMDIGPETAQIYGGILKSAGTVVWNGPMGVFEFPAFAGGTEAVARAIAESGAVSIIGGGDSAAAVKKLGFADQMTHISTGGGASLEFLEGLALPGIECLEDR